MAHHSYKKPVEVPALYMAQEKMSYLQQAERRELSKPFEAIQMSGGCGHRLWDPDLLQENIKRFAEGGRS